MARRTELLRYMKTGSIKKKIGDWILIEEDVEGIDQILEGLAVEKMIDNAGLYVNMRFALIGKVKDIDFHKIKFEEIALLHGVYDGHSAIQLSEAQFKNLKDTNFKWLSEEDVEKEIVARSL